MLEQPIEIAILDSGVDPRVVPGPIRSVRFAETAREVPDVTGHGTSCARLVASGVPEGTRFSDLRVLDASNRCRPSDLIAALEWCIARRVDVASVSTAVLGAEYVYAFERICARAAGEGMILVAAGEAAGRTCWPAMLPQALGVGVAEVESDTDFFFDPESPIEMYACGDPPGEGSQGERQRPELALLAGSEAGSSSFATARMAARTAHLLHEHRIPRDGNRSAALRELLAAAALPMDPCRLRGRAAPLDLARRTAPLRIESELGRRLAPIRRASALVSPVESAILAVAEPPFEVEQIPLPSPLLGLLGPGEGPPVPVPVPVAPAGCLRSRCLEAEVDAWILGSLTPRQRREVPLAEAAARGIEILHLDAEPEACAGLSASVELPGWRPGPDPGLREALRSLDPDLIFRSEIPTLTLVSAADRHLTAAFAEALLTSRLRDRGWRVAHLGSHPAAEIFGADAALHSSRLGSGESPEMRIGHARALVASANWRNEGSDLLVAGVGRPVAEHLLSESFFPDYGLDALFRLLGCQPDAFGVIVDEMVAPASLRRILRGLAAWLDMNCLFVGGVSASALAGLPIDSSPAFSRLERVAEDEGARFLRWDEAGARCACEWIETHHGLDHRGSRACRGGSTAHAQSAERGN